MKNACIVGYGNIGPIHANAINSIENANWYAICDTDDDLVKSCCDEFGIVGYTSFDDVLKDENIDCVHICTPHYLHKDMTIKALLSGKDVVLEKPVGITKAELDELLKVANNSASRLTVMLQNRKNECIKKLVEIVNSTPKTPKGICGFLTWNRGAKYYNSADWRGTYAYEGGALMINQAIHLVDMMQLVGGKVSGIKAHMSNMNLEGVIEAEDTANMLIYYENGVRGCFYATNASTVSCPYRLEVIYDNVTYRYADYALYEIKSDELPKIIAHDDIASLGKSMWGNSHKIAIEDFYNDKDYITINDAYDTNNIVFAMYESAKENGKLIKF